MDRIFAYCKTIHLRWLAYATVLVAFFLRVYRLADKNVWWDEGWSLWLSQKDLGWIALRTAADEHPPLHYWMLHFWNVLAGTDAAAGRFLSVAFGVLTVAIVYRLGKRVGGGGVGVLAALLLALARFHIWWSQDIKNYTPSILFAFAALWFALDLLRNAPLRQRGETRIGPASPSPSGGPFQTETLVEESERSSTATLILAPGSNDFSCSRATPVATTNSAPGSDDLSRSRATLVATTNSAPGSNDMSGSGATLVATTNPAPGSNDLNRSGATLVATTNPARLSMHLSRRYPAGIAGERPPLAKAELSDNGPTPWPSFVAYAVCAALALWTHYLAALVLIAVNVYAAALFLARGRSSGRRFAVWVVAQLLAAALFAPWMYLYLANAAAWSAAPAFDFGVFLKLVATVLPLGVTTNIDDYALPTALITLIAAVPVISDLWSVISRQSTVASDQLPVISDQSSVTSDQLSIISKGRRPDHGPLITDLRSLITDLRSRITHHVSHLTHHASPSTDHRLLITDHWSLITIVLLPPVLIYLLSLTPVAFFAPKIQARYLLVLLPAYVLLVALGIAALRRLSWLLGVAAAGVVVATSLWVLSGYYGERRLSDDYATLANTINSFAQPGDLLLLDTDQEWPTLLYYMRSPLEWLGAPNGAAMNAASADALVQRALVRHDSVWLVAIPDALATDPQRLLESSLARAVPKQYEQTFGDKRLALYARAPRDLASVPPANLAPQHLLDVSLSGGARLLGFDLPVREVRTGDTLRLVTYWNMATAGPVALGLRNVAAKVVDLPAGERQRVQTDFVIPPSAVGDVAVDVGAVNVATVRVEARAAAGQTGPITHALDYALGEAGSESALLHLAGYDLPATRVQAGGTLAVTLYWRADRPVDKNYMVFVHLLGEQFNPAHNDPLWGQIDRVPRDGSYPTTAWVPGQLVADAYRVPVDPHAPPGRYQIEVGLYDPGTGKRLAVIGGQDSIVVAQVDVN